MQTMTEKIARAEQIERCLSRRAEINTRIKVLERERAALIAASQVTGNLELAWRQSIDYHCRNFVSALSSQVVDGRIPQIDFNSASACVFINKEKWLAAIPELVSKCSSSSYMEEGECQRRLVAIAGELSPLEQELRGL